MVPSLGCWTSVDPYSDWYRTGPPSGSYRFTRHMVHWYMPLYQMRRRIGTTASSKQWECHITCLRGGGVVTDRGGVSKVFLLVTLIWIRTVQNGLSIGSLFTTCFILVPVIIQTLLYVTTTHSHYCDSGLIQLYATCYI